MGFSRGVNTITLKEIKDRVSEFDILSFYFKEVKEVPCFINSPFRKDDKASFGIYSNDGKTIKFKDLSIGMYGGIFDMLELKFNCSLPDVLNIINDDINNINKNNITYSNTQYIIDYNKAISYKPSNKTKDLKCKIRNWNTYDLEYWNQFGISKKALMFGNVYPISHIFVIKNSNTTTITCDKYAYAYIEHKDNKCTMKIYQPFSKNYKWINGHDSSVWDLWSKLPQKGENLIITSSRKDALNLWSNLRIPTISLQGEGYIPKEKIINELKSRFNNIFILFDNDYKNELNPGRTNALKLVELFNLKMVEIPKEYESKDPSDLYKNKGKNIYFEVMNTIFKPYNINFHYNK